MLRCIHAWQLRQRPHSLWPFLWQMFANVLFYNDKNVIINYDLFGHPDFLLLSNSKAWWEGHHFVQDTDINKSTRCAAASHTSWVDATGTNQGLTRKEGPVRGWWPNGWAGGFFSERLCWIWEATWLVWSCRCSVVESRHGLELT